MRQTRSLRFVVRGDDLYKDMSAYLARRIEQTPNVEVLLNTEVRRMHGDTHLRSVELLNKKTGAAPRTDWLPPEIEKDAKGFIRTGPAGRSAPWTAGRDPYLLETSRPGVLAAGDVRSGSIKRVASAVGEGATSGLPSRTFPLDKIECGEWPCVGTYSATRSQRAALTRERRRDRRHTEKSLLAARSFF